MNAQPERVAQSLAGTLEPAGPSLIVKTVMRPMTKMLNPLIVKLAAGGTSTWPRRSGTPADGRGEPTPRRSAPGAAAT